MDDSVLGMSAQIWRLRPRFPIPPDARYQRAYGNCSFNRSFQLDSKRRGLISSSEIMPRSLLTPSRRLFLAAGALALPAAQAFAEGAAVLRAVSLEARGQRTRLALDLSRAVSPRTFFLDGPARFVIDLPDTRLALGPRSGEGPGAGIVSRYRYAPRPDGARLVLDLAGPAALERQDVLARRNPGLLIELSGAPIESPAAAPAARGSRRKVIVIDAGHGGHDPGAIGVTGVREKDVVLDTALNLRQALEARGRYRVELTRDSDIFIPLDDRVRIARDHEADLFLSLHADANQNDSAVGASVYTLSERGGQRARGMMDAQNWQIDLGDAPRAGLVGQILTDLTQRETSNRSVAYAEVLINQLEGVTPLLRNTHRNAGLFVLLAPDVPAALLEMGFLTNAGDERRLADQRARARMADAVANSIDHYFAAPRTYMARA